VLVASTSIHRQRIQRLGRVLRTHENKDMAQIFTVYVTNQEEGRLVKEIGELSEVASVRWMEMSK